VGIITYIGLTLLNIPYALPLALLAGLLEIVPNLGPTIAAVPAIAFAYISGGPVMAGFVTLFYVIVQQLENNLIVPKIMQQNADVNPLVSIIVMLVGLKLAGIPGVLLAVPSYIVVRALYSHWFHRS
jgi:predicted PurR-regulated permease PerM